MSKPLLATDALDPAIMLLIESESPNELLQELLTATKQTLNLNEGAFIMLTPDQLDLPDLSPAVVIMAKADGIKSGNNSQVNAVGECGLLQLTRHEAYSISPEITARGLTGKLPFSPYEAQITVIQQPKHGKLWAPDGEIWISSKISSQIGSGSYVPNPGFAGKDSFVMQVKANGHRVNVHYFIAVTSDDGHTLGEYCKKELWKISQSDLDSGSKDFAAWQHSAQLSALLASAS